jgi:hypothetical protein
LDIRREEAIVPDPQLWQFPIVAGNVRPAFHCAAGTGELIIGAGIAHGIVNADLFAWCDIAHRHHADLPVHPGVWVAGMIDVIARFAWDRRDQIKAIFDLNAVGSG